MCISSTILFGNRRKGSTCRPTFVVHLMAYSHQVLLAPMQRSTKAWITYVWICVFLSVAATDPNLPSTEYQALIDLFVATNGIDWYENNWNFSATANPCTDEWIGVECILPEPFAFYHVYNLSLNSNELYGTIPVSVSNLTYLANLDLGINEVFGTIPTELLWLPSLHTLALAECEINGTLPLPPPGFDTTQSQLRSLVLPFTDLTGSLPVEVLLQLSRLVFLDLSLSFYLTGTLPAELLWSPTLVHLNLQGIYMYSTIPPPPAHYNVSNNPMQYLALSECRLSGTLPVELGSLTHLQEFGVVVNKLSGSVAMLPTSLRIASLWMNLFTGELHHLPFLTSGNIIAATFDFNCISGTIPNNICDNKQLDTISLTQMSNQAVCSSMWFPNSAYIPTHALHGTIPACLFTLPAIQEISLAGNYLTGTVPSGHDIVIKPLSYNGGVSLSYNMLRGPFPHHLGNVVLYADHNRFSGGLMYPPNNTQHHYHDQTVYYAGENNRLSGPLPSSIINAPKSYATSHLMSGNLFSCDWGENNVPEGSVEYQCGTNDFDKTYTAWWVCVLVVLVVMGVMYCVYSDTLVVVDTLKLWYNTAASSDLHELHEVWSVGSVVVTCGVVCTVLCVVVLAPVYAALTAYFGTYTYQYSWTVASVLLSGPVAFAAQLVVFVLVLCVAVYMLLIRGSTGNNSNHGSSNTDKHDIGADLTHKPSTMRILIVCTVYVMLNFSVVGTVNVAFVATSLYTPSLRYQVAISTFKIGWSAFFLPYLSRWVVYELSARRNDVFGLELFVSLMNNIALPYLAVLAVSSDCFFDLYRGALMQYDSYSVYENGYYYSYQCAYTYFNYYAVPFMYVCMFTTFGQPIVEFVLLQLHYYAAAGSIWYIILNRVVPRVLKPIESNTELILARNVFRPYFDSTQFLVSLFTNLALILTLGVVFPPLALCLAVTMVATMLYAMLKVGRMLTHAAEAKQPQYAELIRQESTRVVTAGLLPRACCMLLVCGCLFMALFLFDTLGDAQGVNNAYWVLIVVPLLPLVGYVTVLVWQFVVCDYVLGGGHNKVQEDRIDDGNSIELKSVDVISPMAVATSV